MTRRSLSSRGERTRAAAAAIAINLFLGAALVTGLKLREERRESAALETFDVRLPPPPPPPVIAQPRSQAERADPEGATGRKAEASAVVAVPARIVRPSPVTAAPVPASGSAPSSGQAAAGSGPGSGGSGSGPGGGGDGLLAGIPVSRAQMIRGMIGDRDNPGERYVGRVVVRLDIAADGTVTGCALVESSGQGVTDALTCRLSYRILFRPARLASGQAVRDHTFYVVNWRRR